MPPLLHVIGSIISGNCSGYGWLVIGWLLLLPVNYPRRRLYFFEVAA